MTTVTASHWNYILWSLEHEAQLNPVGRQVLRQRMVDILATRLRWRTTCGASRKSATRRSLAPCSSSDCRVPAPDAAPHHRGGPSHVAPLWYEVRYPSPAPDWDFHRLPTRADHRRQGRDGGDAGSQPELLPSTPWMPQGRMRDIMLLEQSFYSQYPGFRQYSVLRRLAGGAATIPPATGISACCCSFCSGRKAHWAAGSAGPSAPHHLHYMDLVFKVFPDAKVVQSHRDPVEPCPPFTSLIAGVWT